MGVIEEDPHIMDPHSLGRVVGPSVHLYSTTDNVWYGSVLVAVHTDIQEAVLSFTCGGAPPADVRAEVLYKHAFGGTSWAVLRFPLRVKMQRQAAMLQYSVKLGGAREVPSGTIPLPAADEDWHIAGYSCNDQRQLPKTGTACWDTLRNLHKKKPLHLLMGTGDQLYNDNIWAIPCCASWTGEEDKDKMRKREFTAEETQEIGTFYFGAYLRWIKFHPLGDDLGNIPQVNTWDDHDIFDGFGSYPPRLQTCTAFQQIFAECIKMYAVFQQHSGERSKVADGFWPTAGYSWLLQLGPRLAVAAVDSRVQRSRQTIVPRDMLDELDKRVKGLPSSVEHLVLVSAVPIAFPEVSHLEKFMSSLENKNNLLVKTGVMSKLMNSFGEPELLDDIVDHWGASIHVEEKAALLGRVRALARDTKTRISLLSGDVHQCIFCFMCSKKDMTGLPEDPGFVPQIVSSAIGYVPPGNAITAVLDKYAGNKAHKVTKWGGGDGAIYEAAGHLFKDAGTRPSASPRLANRNNFVEFAVVAGNKKLGGAPLLEVTYHVRAGTAPVDGGPDTSEHKVALPPLMRAGEAADAAQAALLKPLLPPPPGMLSKITCGALG